MPTNKRPVRFDMKIFLYFLGAGMWLTFTSFSVSSYPLAVFTENSLLVRIAQIGCFSLSFFIISLIDYLKGPFRRYTLVKAVVSAFALSVIIALTNALIVQTMILQYISAACLAFGSACGYCQWLCMLANQSYRKAQWLLALGSIIPTTMMFVFDLIPNTDIKASVTFGIFGPLSIILLCINAHLNEVNGENYINARPNAKTKSLTKDLLLPIVCAMALVLITPIASTALSDTEGTAISSGSVLSFAHAFSLILLMSIWFIFKKDMTLPQLYCIFLPVFASLVFLLPLLAPELTWVILFIGDGSFFFVSILMVTTCLSLSHEYRFSPISLYGLFAGCVYFSNVIQLALEYWSRSGAIDFEPYAASMVLLYVLVIPAFFIIVSSRNRKTKNKHTAQSTIACTIEGLGENPLSDPESACSRIALKHGLSNRQSELLVFFALGRDVAYIANTLYLSPNTIRSYRKKLYAELGVHSKQELIDLVEAERKAGTEADR